MGLRELKDRATSLFQKKQYAKAAEAFGKASASAPQDLALRQHWAVALHRAGQSPRAIGLLQEIAAAYSSQGQLLRAIAVSKLLLDLEPAHTGAQDYLARLYSRRDGPPRSPSSHAPRARQKRSPTKGLEATTSDDRPKRSRRSRPPKSPPELDLSEEPTDRHFLSDIGGDADNDLTDEFMVGGLPPPSWAPDQKDQLRLDSPLFENLATDDFIALLQQCQRRSFDEGDLLITQGDAARSFFVLVEGTLRVFQGAADEATGQLELAQLSPGDFFGEMALVSKSPRVASVIGTSAGSVLEFSEKVLEKLVVRAPSVKRALDEFVRARLLQNAMASLEIFRAFDRAQRRQLFPRFTLTEVAGGTALLRQGRRADAFSVILAGCFRVDRDGERLSDLAVGDTFGEVSLLTGAPATASVVAEGQSKVLQLPAGEFQRLVGSHPTVKRHADTLRRDRPPKRAVSADKIPADVPGNVLV